MKNLTKLILGVSSLSLLASCSTMGANDTVAKPEPMKAESTIVKSESMKTETVKADSKTMAPTAKIALQKSGDEIIAIIHTTYNNNPEGSVQLHWKAPKDTTCYNTSFPITKYGETNDKTWAAVELKQGNKYCAGKWSASVEFQGKSIATDSINIEKTKMEMKAAVK